MNGSPAHFWDTGYLPASHAELLPNGNLLFAGMDENGQLTDLEGAGGIILEMDWDGNVVWEHRDGYLHHGCYRMDNGNTLVLRWVKVPAEIAAKAGGGQAGTEREGIMWGDALQEITPDGKVDKEWIAHEHLDPDLDAICPICPRSTWTHANACVVLEDGSWLISFMKTNSIAMIDKRTGNIAWRWGRGELAHQHSPSVMDNGHILVFDNGYHPNGFAMGESRLLEINPSTEEIIWHYEGGKDLPQFFYSSTMSNCQRLPNGNTFACEGTSGRLFEITPWGEPVWEYVTTPPMGGSSAHASKRCMLHGAYRYGIDYSGLKRPRPLPAKPQIKPGTPIPEKDASASSRHDMVGY
jgi:hypothetical protein